MPTKRGGGRTASGPEIGFAFTVASPVVLAPSSRFPLHVSQGKAGRKRARGRVTGREGWVGVRGGTAPPLAAGRQSRCAPRTPGLAGPALPPAPASRAGPGRQGRAGAGGEEGPGASGSGEGVGAQRRGLPSPP